jgi:hypothetical protein
MAKPMGAAETVAALAGFEQRGAGSDAERRAAQWLSREVATARRQATVETFWCRPNWAVAAAWHALLAIAGSLVSVSSPEVGGALILVALAAMVVDALTGWSPGRRLTPERASQNVVSTTGGEQDRVRLIVTANYDAGRAGLVYRDFLRRPVARLRQRTGGAGPGWQGWMVLATAWLLATAVLRAVGVTGSPVGIAQVIPTAALVVGLALLLDLASAGFGPAANDNASGAAVAVALARALDVAPPRRLDVELVLQGAGDGGMIGLTRYLRARRKQIKAADTIVLGIAAAGAGEPAWWASDGPLVPLRYFRRLGAIARRVAGPETELGARPHRGRGITPALPARYAGLPAITIGCLDKDGLAPRSHQRGDVPAALDRDGMDRLLGLALTLVDAIDADLRRTSAAGPQGSRASRAAATH